MRKQIKVIGISHKVGKSRDGMPYDFHLLHATYHDDDSVGLSALSVKIPDDVVSSVKVDKDYILFSHFYNGKECFDGIFDI